MEELVVITAQAIIYSTKQVSTKYLDFCLPVPITKGFDLSSSFSNLSDFMKIYYPMASRAGGYQTDLAFLIDFSFGSVGST